MNTSTTKGSVGQNVAQSYGFISSFAGPIAMAVGVLALPGAGAGAAKQAATCTPVSNI